MTKDSDTLKCYVVGKQFLRILRGNEALCNIKSTGPRELSLKNERSIVKRLKLTLIVLCLASGTLMAQEAKVTSLMSKDLTDISSNKEGLMIMVEYPPNGVDPIHRHNAHGFIYVLEGSIVMQVKGGKEVTLTPGQTFYESPDDVHIVGRNASNTKPAKFLVVFVKDKGAPVLVPEK
jgi:quercetin dioxygenase-like cupin family protein